MPTTNPVPSSDPLDFVFNVQKVDEVVNATALTFTDRLGNVRQTLAGLSSEFPLAQANADAAAASAADALASETAAASSAADAQAAKVAAEAARDSSFANAKGADTIADARALVADTETFIVYAADALTFDAYRRTGSTTQVFLGPYPTAAGVDYIYKEEKIGRQIDPITGSTGASKVYVFSTPVASDGYVVGFNMFAASSGTVAIKVFNKAGDTFTQSGSNFEVSVSSGLNKITGLSIKVDAGQCLGLWSNGKLVSNVASGAEPWRAATPTGDLTTFTATTDSTVPLEIAFVFGSGAAVNQIYSVDAKTEENAAQIVITNGRVTSLENEFVGEIERIGLSGTPSSSSVASAKVYLFLDAVNADGAVTGFDCYASADGQMAVKVFDRDGDTFTQDGEDAPVQVSTGLNQITGLNVPVRAGQYLAIWSNGLLNFNFTITTGTTWRAPSPTGNVTSFTSTADNTTQLQMAFNIQVGTIQTIELRVDALEQAQDAFTFELSYGDDVAAASAIVTGLEIDASITRQRHGTNLVIDSTITLPAATSGVRYDLIQLSGISASTPGVTAGTLVTEAGGTGGIAGASGAPAVPVSCLPVWWAKVSGSTVTLIDAWRLRDGVDKRIANQDDADRERTKRLLGKTRSKIMRRAALKIVAFGDSIQALSTGAGSTTSPNGATRDVAAAALSETRHYLRDGYPAAFVDAIPLYTSVQLGRADDGAGAVHTRVGYIWSLVSALENAGYALGTDLTYNNWSIPGYATSNAVSGSTPTSWLTSAVADAADLAIVCLGMNELGNADTEARLRVIVNTFKAAGTEVLVVGTQRPRGFPGADSTWIRTHEINRRAAYDTGAAFLSMMPLYDDRFSSGLGIALADVCTANGYNHPGVEEFRAIGDHLVRAVL